MSVCIETDYYNISLFFDNGVRITGDTIANPTITLSTTFNSLLDVIAGDVSIARSLLSRRLRMKGSLRHPVASLRFYRLMRVLLQEAER